MRFPLPTADIPDCLQGPLQSSGAAVRRSLEAAGYGDLELPESAARVLACSPYVARVCARAPADLAAWCAEGLLEDDQTGVYDYAQVGAALAAAEDEKTLMRLLREHRNRIHASIAWRDIAGVLPLDAVMHELSRFADTAIEATRAWLQRDLEASVGTPYAEDGAAQRLTVLAMGKLGADELNFSSDVDLILCYPSNGETAGGRRSLSNQEYFNRLARRLVKVLGEVTEDGFAFRVDTRLRPFGESGSLTWSFGAMLAYYEAHARDWERYALIKGRIAAGDRSAGARILEQLRPFVFRRYLDFGALESLRDMKALITEEVARRGLANDIKRGSGGIREVEFIGQTFQLIRGGREPALRDRRILKVLEALAVLDQLPVQAVAELSEAYRFLRTVENRLQQAEDQQTHALPESEAGRARLALGLGFADWPEAARVLDGHRARVRAHFESLLAGGASVREDAPGALVHIWNDADDAEALTRALSAAGMRDAAGIAARLAQLQRSPKLRRLGPSGQKRLSRLIPAILEAARDLPQVGLTVSRIFEIIEAVGQRSVYFTLLSEHPSALTQLTRLCAASPWVADQIGRQPILLDQLLDPRLLSAPPTGDELRSELRHALTRFPAGDIEQIMEALRQFKHAQVLRVAAADIAEVLPVAEVSNHLSAIAELVLQAALDNAWAYLCGRHGEPWYRKDAREYLAGFAVIAYGKLGGLELGYGSDLDLVFVHSSRGEHQQTDGERPIDNNLFFTRLAQRLIHLLQTLTPAGRAYEIDIRLRPSGESGLLVSSLDAFRDYQLGDAWTWEHQALIRARPVAGSPEVGRQFAEIRTTALCQSRDAGALRGEIVNMRERMRRELAKQGAGIFDLKQGRGGITDIEFMVQYAVLRWARAYPQLLGVTDNLRLLEALADHGLLDPKDCRSLHDAYFAYRAEVHRQALQEQDALVSADAFEDHRQAVSELWRVLMLE